MICRVLPALAVITACFGGACASEPRVYLGEQEETSSDAGWWNDFDAAAARRQWEAALREAFEENCREPRSICLQHSEERFDSICEALEADHELRDLRPCCDEPDAGLDFPERWFCSREDEEP